MRGRSGEHRDRRDTGADEPEREQPVRPNARERPQRICGLLRGGDLLDPRALGLDRGVACTGRDGAF